MHSELAPTSAVSWHHSAVLDFSSESSPLFSHFRPAAASHFGLRDRTPFKIVMAYEDTDAAERARQWLDELRADSLLGMELEIVQWPFDFLSDPESLDTATSDTADAHLLVFATSSLEPVPSAGEAWLASCLAAPIGRAMTLVAIFGTDAPCTISIEHGCTDSATDRAELMPDTYPLLAPAQSFAA